MVDWGRIPRCEFRSSLNGVHIAKTGLHWPVFPLRLLQRRRPRPFDEGFIALLILRFHIVEQPAALGDHFQKAPAGMVVFLVILEVPCKV